MSPVADDMVEPLLHKYVIGVVPPLTVTVAVPSLPPLQLTSVVLPIDAAGAPASVTLAVAVAVHPLASVTVTE